MKVYVARYMPSDADKPVRATRIGATRIDAVESIKEAAVGTVSGASRLEWPSDKRTVKTNGWIFTVKEKELINQYSLQDSQ